MSTDWIEARAGCERAIALLEAGQTDSALDLIKEISLGLKELHKAPADLVRPVRDGFEQFSMKMQDGEMWEFSLFILDMARLVGGLIEEPTDWDEIKRVGFLSTRAGILFSKDLIGDAVYSQGEAAKQTVRVNEHYNTPTTQYRVVYESTLLAHYMHQAGVQAEAEEIALIAQARLQECLKTDQISDLLPPTIVDVMLMATEITSNEDHKYVHLDRAVSYARQLFVGLPEESYMGLELSRALRAYGEFLLKRGEFEYAVQVLGPGVEEHEEAIRRNGPDLDLLFGRFILKEYLARALLESERYEEAFLISDSNSAKPVLSHPEVFEHAMRAALDYGVIMHKAWSEAGMMNIERVAHDVAERFSQRPEHPVYLALQRDIQTAKAKIERLNETNRETHLRRSG